jgi:hypothetical protein
MHAAAATATAAAAAAAAATAAADGWPRSLARSLTFSQKNSKNCSLCLSP